MDIRHLKTIVNGMTRKLNKDFVNESINNLNQNTLNNFTIKLYLKFYDLINEEMQTALNDIVKHGTEDF